jgi:uncharacterized DUF497 family protein/predicted DNA binding CopG/RHH family protein
VVDLSKIAEFDWDAGNARKNERHGVSAGEAEEVFFSAPLLLLDDQRHSQDEPRYHALGVTVAGRPLHVCFTLRRDGTAIRVISARDMSRKRERLMSKRQKITPRFSSEAAERAFWEKNDSAEYLDWSRARLAAFPNLKPSTKTISLRLPEHLLDAIKVAANARDVPYQSLIKVWLQEKVHER